MEQATDQSPKKLLKHKRRIPPSKSDDPTKKNPKDIIRRKNKKPHRKKLLKNKLEFLLSDINLFHDNYLKKYYLTHNKSISPEIFLKFNSIKSLLSDIEKTEKKKSTIIKSIESSNYLIYIKASDKIKRKKDYDEKTIDINLYDENTVYIPDLPKFIKHENIYDIFNEFQIDYIFFKKNKENKKAFIILKNKDDVQKIINKFNNNAIQGNNLLNNKIIHVIKKSEILNNELNENSTAKNSNENSKNNIIIEKNRLTETNIDNNICISFCGLKENINLIEFKKCLNELQAPLFIDINRNNNSAIMRFKSKKESENFLNNFNSKGNSLLSGMFKNGKVNKPRELDKKDNDNYLSLVRKEIQQFKENKLNKRLSKLKLDN